MDIDEEERLTRLSDDELDTELGRALRALGGPGRAGLRVVPDVTAPRDGRTAGAAPPVDVSALLRRQALLARELRRRRESSRPPAASGTGVGTVLPFRTARSS